MCETSHWKQRLWLLLCLPASLAAEQLRFDTQEEWQRWKLPLGAVELSEDGILKPVRVRKNINAVLDAQSFGGGIRGAGSNQREAGLVMDGDPTTGWSPNWNDPPEAWWIEIDLGRAVSARQVRLIFAEEALSFELFDLLLSTGEQARDLVGNLIPGTLIYRFRERFKENQRHEVRFALEQPDNSLIQVLRLEVLKTAPGARLVEVEVEAFGDNLALSLGEKGGQVDIVVGVDSRDRNVVPLGNALLLADGGLNTAWWYGRASTGSTDILAHITLDLGAIYWVDLVRLISAYLWWYDFGFYELLTSNGSLAPDGTLIWQRQFSGWPPQETRRRGLADHHFSLTPIRYARLRWKYWDARCGDESGGEQTYGCWAGGYTEEFQVYGEGYPQEVRLRSPLLDLGADKNINLLRWQAQTPPDTRIEFRSRTGNELEQQITYHDKNGKEVTQKRWEKLIPSFRGPVDTTFAAGRDWSPWSRPYLSSGEEFQSPSPRRHLELEARVVSDTPDAAASLDWLAVEYSEPLAENAVGEIYPVEAKPGVEQEFSYFLKAPATTGFDRLSIESSTPLRFADAALDDVRTQVEVEQDSTGFGLRFPRAVSEGELVEVRFSATVFMDATRFEVFLEDSQQSVRQRVEPGDATAQVASSTDVVRLPLGSELLAGLSFSSRALTPNGDGVNDELKISFALVNVLEGRPLRLQLFDLSGRMVREIEKEAMAGAQEFVWDGRDAGGDLLPPGMYILRLTVEGDARSEQVSRLVGVVY